MMHDMWKLFPRLIEKKINALLDEAEPNRMKSFHIYKTCQNENLWNKSFEDFREELSRFFSLPLNERTKSRFDYALNRPMHKSVFENFQLDFRNAVVNGQALLAVSNWAHHMLRINTRSESPVISLDVMTKTMNSIVNPGPFDKAQDIEFDDFCGSWKRVCFNLFGRRFEADLQQVLNELIRIDQEQQLLEQNRQHLPRIYLTQTEIDWTQGLLSAAQELSSLPKFPLSRGPQKEALVEIEKVAQLYSLVMESDKPEFIPYRQRIKETLIFRCEDLLKKRQA
jgi:hypothetical protein